MPSTSTNLLRSVKNHPIRAIAVGGGVVAGVILVRKAARTAARVVTIKVAARAATDVAKAVRGPAKKKMSLFGRSLPSRRRSRSTKS